MQEHVLGAAVAKAVAVLHRNDRHELARAFELLHRDVREPDVAHLALFLHVGERSNRHFERHLWIDSVELVQVDALELEALEAAFEVLAQLFRLAVRVPAPGARALEAALRRDDEALRVGMQRLADEDLAGMRTVAL